MLNNSKCFATDKDMIGAMATVFRADPLRCPHTCILLSNPLCPHVAPSFDKRGWSTGVGRRGRRRKESLGGGVEGEGRLCPD